MKRNTIDELKPRALEFLRNSDCPIGVGDIAKNLNVAWGTARQILMELLLENKIECEKTSNFRIFRSKTPRKEAILRK